MEQETTFHPFIKYCALFGAVTSALAAIATIIDAVFFSPSLFDAGVGLGKAVAIFYLAWCFWYAFKHSKNPFKVKPFSKK